MRRAASFSAKATVSVLSKTLMSARCTVMCCLPKKQISVSVARMEGKEKSRPRIRLLRGL
jgi:hypothetical protein